VAEDVGEFEDAEVLMTSGRELARRAGLEWAGCIALYHLGIIAYGRGELELARTRLDEARAAAQALEDLLVPYWSLPYLALIACQQGDLVLAAEFLHQALLTVQGSGLRQGDETFLGAFAVIAARLGEWQSAAELLGAAAIRNHDNAFPFPERTAFAEVVVSARQQLGLESYAEAWAIGRMLRLDGITAVAKRVLVFAEGSRVEKNIDHDPSTLTAREQEVLRLLVEGRSNREIGELLFISHRTATTHVTHILAKFGVETRAAAVTYAFQHDLI
jgi:DNA-binding CsgD family transcriptional regulator